MVTFVVEKVQVVGPPTTSEVVIDERPEVVAIVDICVDEPVNEY